MNLNILKNRTFAHILSLTLISPLLGDDIAVAAAESEDGWNLVFNDEFDRDEIGEGWTVYSGDWNIENGSLVGKGQIYVTKAFPGNHRIVFEAESDEPNDLSPFIHAGERGFVSGYFLQFGGLDNAFNVARRLGKDMSTDYWHMIEPGQVHKIIAEFDGRHVRLTVDGETVHEYEENDPLTGEAHQRVGLYIHNQSRVHAVKVYLQNKESAENG